MRKETNGLDDIADATAQLHRVQAANVLTAQLNLSLVGFNHRIDHAQDRRFAAADGPIRTNNAPASMRSEKFSTAAAPSKCFDTECNSIIFASAPMRSAFER